MSTAVAPRPGTRAKIRYLRMSASKVRIVLDLIRGKSVAEALQILALSERLASRDIEKCLRSAIANAEHNDDIPAEELFVSECFADEGPTIKRFRPRARGRAGSIHKQTCHVTIAVSRFTTEEIDEQNASAAAKATSRGTSGGSKKSSSANRSARVAASKGEDAPVADSTEEVEAETIVVTSAAKAEEAEDTAVEDTAAEETEEAVSEATDATVDSDEDGESNATDESPYGDGSQAATEDDAMPEGFEIKGNASSKLYHVPGSSFYNRTKAEVWFATEEAAEAAGFQKPASQRDEA